MASNPRKRKKRRMRSPDAAGGAAPAAAADDGAAVADVAAADVADFVFHDILREPHPRADLDDSTAGGGGGGGGGGGSYSPHLARRHSLASIINPDRLMSPEYTPAAQVDLDPQWMEFLPGDPKIPDGMSYEEAAAATAAGASGDPGGIIIHGVHLWYRSDPRNIWSRMNKFPSFEPGPIPDGAAARAKRHRFLEFLRTSNKAGQLGGKRRRRKTRSKRRKTRRKRRKKRRKRRKTRRKRRKRRRRRTRRKR